MHKYDRHKMAGYEITPLMASFASPSALLGGSYLSVLRVSVAGSLAGFV